MYFPEKFVIAFPIHFSESKMQTRKLTKRFTTLESPSLIFGLLRDIEDGSYTSDIYEQFEGYLPRVCAARISPIFKERS